MRRVGRIFFDVRAGVSPVLCVAAAGVWVRSYFVGDHANWPVGAHPPARRRLTSRPSVGSVR